MNQPENRAKRAAAAIAALRVQVASFTYDEGKTLLKYAKCPYHQLMMPLLIKEGILKKGEDGLYFFPDSKPVFFGALRPGLDRIAKNVYKNTRKFLDTRKKKDIPPTEEEEIQEKIIFLKQRGYRVFQEL